MIYIKKSWGPRTVFWETRDVTGHRGEVVLLTQMKCCRFVKHSIREITKGSSFSVDSFSSKKLWGTLSNAFVKTINIASVVCSDSMLRKRSLVRKSDWVSHEKLFFSKTML